MLHYAGESRQIRQEDSALTVALGFALVYIYLVLAAQFQSFRDPLIVLLGSVSRSAISRRTPCSRVST